LAADAFDQLRVGVLFGSFSAVLVLFCFPVILLGTISPFAIRLAITDATEAGRVSGRIYASQRSVLLWNIFSTRNPHIGTARALSVRLSQPQ
jgi:hypothetical protein